MANKQINQYTAASGIDAINDYLLIDPGGTGAYNKINRNVFLGITGSPIGSSDSQTISNKTIGITNTITVSDSLFTIQDNADNTKQIQFQLSGLTTGTTRTLTVPNASVTLASLTGTETLTNKTITSPTITGGTIDNATITVDSIAGHTTGTVVTIANLQISNGVLNSANAVTATSIAAGAIQPQALFTGTGSGWSWQSYTPTFTNVTTGNGTITGKYIQIGKTVFYSIRFLFGSSSAFTGAVSYTLPITSVNYTTAFSRSVGVVTCLRPGGGAAYFGSAMWLSTTTVEPDVGNATGTFTQLNSITSTSPQTWQAADILDVMGYYEAA